MFLQFLIVILSFLQKNGHVLKDRQRETVEKKRKKEEKGKRITFFKYRCHHHDSPIFSIMAPKKSQTNLTQQSCIMFLKFGKCFIKWCNYALFENSILINKNTLSNKFFIFNSRKLVQITNTS